MFLIIGLGNPGVEYQKTPHNAGFMALDEFQKEHGFPDFKLSKKHSSLISDWVLSLSKDNLRQAKVLLAKPQTFMNNSGKAVASLVRLSFPKLNSKLNLTKELIVVHDDIDIPLGKVKVSRGSGSAGHKGVDSIIQSLGTKDFTRIRIGIQPAKGKPEGVENFVLQKFSKTELSFFQSVIQEASISLLSLIG
jgi:peptidyl-tRNA hydrolase, PTH1 family